MKTERIDEYRRYGCNFYGKLVVVKYQEEMYNDPNWGKFGAEVVYDYLDKAKKLIEERYGTNIEVLLSVPELVVRISE